MKSRTPARSAASALSGSPSEPSATIGSPGCDTRSAAAAALAACAWPPEKSTKTSTGLSPAIRCASAVGSSGAGSTVPADTSVCASQLTCSPWGDAQTK
ncbi:hypothetical protein NCF_01502 [Burkholderia pseudomallei]|nr:hypothetical protein X994_1073 [Burkholderia pseudomallei]CAJ8533818.1 Uncharacterised protein [Burkholderia pseudomallei]